MISKNKQLANEAAKLLDKLEHGQTYPAEYIVQRFTKAADDHSQDLLINHMKDVLVKIASKRQYIYQKEIGQLYDKMYGFSGGHTAFRNALGDLLPEERQFAKVAYPGSKTRTLEEKPLETIHKDSELSDAFSVLFSLGGDSSFGTYHPGQNKNVEKAVIGKLANLGRTPIGVDIIQANEHFILCAANYQSNNLRKISALIPVQITNGIPREPKHLILGESVVDLDARNLFTCLKEQERNQNKNVQNKYAGERGDGSPRLEEKKVEVPSALTDFANLENTLIAAASKFDNNQINMAMQMVNTELRSFGAKQPTIKIAGSDQRTLLFDVHLNTQFGKSIIHVPVEMSQKMPLLPNRFASDDGGKNQKIYDFSKAGYDEFLSNLNPQSLSIKIARETGTLSTMSYHQLMDQMIEGVANQDYKLSEDVLQVIEARFGKDQFAKAFDYFSQLLKQSSNSSTRKQLIKEAYDRGDLIKIPTSVELYCPKLGLPVSKVSFDDKGRVIPAGRRNKSENQIQDASMSVSQIVFT